jgi:hypothetical protein
MVALAQGNEKEKLMTLTRCEYQGCLQPATDQVNLREFCARHATLALADPDAGTLRLHEPIDTSGPDIPFDEEGEPDVSEL